MNNLRVFLALILIMLFYRLFNIHDKIKVNSSIEKFTTDDINTETEEMNIQVYLNQRLTNFNLNLSEIKELLQKDLNIYKSDEPIILDDDVEVDSAKIKSDSPVFVPTNLYIDGPLKIENRDKGSEISKNLVVGNAELSERDLIYLTNYILPFNVKNSDGSVKKVCIENPDRIQEYVTIDDLEVMEVPQGLTSSEQINRMLQIVREYHIDFENDRITADLVASNTFRVDYNLFNLVKSYPELINQLKPGLDNSVSNKVISSSDRLNNEYVVPLKGSQFNLEKYFTENKPLKYWKLKNIIFTARKGYGYGSGRNLTRMRDYNWVQNNFGIQKYKFDGNYFKSEIIIDAVNLYGLNNILNGSKTGEFCEAVMRESLSEYNKLKNKINSRFESVTNIDCLSGDELKYLTGQKSFRLASRGAQRQDSSPWAATPYLQDYHLKIHSANHDDNDDCTAISHVKTSILSNHWATRGEVAENGNFTIDTAMKDWPQYDTGIICTPTNSN